MSFNFAQLFDGLSRAIFRSGQSLLIVCIENAFISGVSFSLPFAVDLIRQENSLTSRRRSLSNSHRHSMKIKQFLKLNQRFCQQFRHVLRAYICQIANLMPATCP